MNKIVCELCGSNDLIKKDGMFECQNCGTKYSAEEVKKLMIEGKVDISGSTVKVDDTEKITNYFLMAEKAYNADNKKEAEDYCNKIIEVDPTNYKAWLLKGKAAGWQSTLAKLRIEETISAFKTAIQNAPEDEVDKIKEEESNEIFSLCFALISLACDNYAKYGYENQAMEIGDVLSTTGTLVAKSTFMLDNNNVRKFPKMTAEAVKKINSTVVEAFQKIYDRYGGPEKHPNQYAWERYVHELFAAKNLLNTIITLNNANDTEIDIKQNINAYKNLIALTEKLMEAKSYTYNGRMDN